MVTCEMGDILQQCPLMSETQPGTTGEDPKELPLVQRGCGPKLEEEQEQASERGRQRTIERIEVRQSHFRKRMLPLLNSIDTVLNTELASSLVCRPQIILHYKNGETAEAQPGVIENVRMPMTDPVKASWSVADIEWATWRGGRIPYVESVVGDLHIEDGAEPRLLLDIRRKNMSDGTHENIVPPEELRWFSRL